MAATKFIGLGALKEIASQVGGQIIMGPGYNDPELLDRLGVEVISGVQFKRVDTLLVRKGGTTRRKKVGTTVENELGFLKERVLEAKLAWNRFKDNIDNYVETVFGTDGKAGGTYKLQTEACASILKTYAEDLQNCLFFGNMALETSADKEKQKLSLYNGFHTLIQNDINDGIISAKAKNLITMNAISAPAYSSDSTPYDTVVEFYAALDPRLRQQRDIRIICDVLRGIYIAQGYANKYDGHSKVKYLPNGNFTIDEMPRVQFVPTDAMGEGSRLIATIPGNLQYGVDSLSNQTFVKVQQGSDEDVQDIVFQIQSIQGARILNPLSSAFAVSDNTIEENVVAGDYDNSLLTIAVTGSGKVEVNGADYTVAKEFAPNDVIKLKAIPDIGKTFTKWDDGTTDAERTISATGFPMALSATFSA